MTKSKIFLILAVSFLLGIFLASFFEITRTSLLIITVGALTVLVLNRENKKALVASAALICLMLGIWRCNCFLDGALKKMSEVTLGPESFVAAVVEEPEARDKYQKIVARNESGEKILINADVYPSYDYGDKIKVSCNIQKPKNFSEKFDYQMYLAKDGIFINFFIMKLAKAIVKEVAVFQHNFQSLPYKFSFYDLNLIFCNYCFACFCTKNLIIL